MQISKILSDNGQKNLPDNVSGGLKNLPYNLKNHRHLSVFRYLIPALIHTDRQTLTEVSTVGTLSGFQEFFLQPIIKDRPNMILCDKLLCVRFGDFGSSSMLHLLLRVNELA